MRKLFAIAWNDIQLEFSEKIEFLFFLVLPVVFTLIIGLGLQGMYSGDGDVQGDQRYPVVVIDQDASNLSKTLVNTIGASTVIRPALRSQAEAENLFSEGQVVALLTIPVGFEKNLLAGDTVQANLRLAPGDNRTFAIQQAVDAAVTHLSSAAQSAWAATQAVAELNPYEDEAARQAAFRRNLDQALELLDHPPVMAETAYAPEVDVQVATGFEQSSPGQLVTWSLITLLSASQVFVYERLAGTLRRLLVTPTRKATILLGKIVGRLTLGLVQMALLIGFGTLVLHVEWGQSWSALAVIAFCFALASVALGLFLATVSRTTSQANNLTIMFSMLMAALGGAWWPLEVTPPVYQSVVKALPSTWAMLGFTDVIVRGQGLAGVLTEALVLLGFAALFFVLGINRLKFE